MKVPKRLRRAALVLLAALIALGAFALVSAQASAQNAPSNNEIDWG